MSAFSSLLSAPFLSGANRWAHAIGGSLIAQDGPTPPGPDIRPFFLTIILLVVVYFFMVARPQRAEAKKRQSMLDDVNKGDMVVTVGGIHGKVESINKDKGIVTLEIAPKISVKVNKSALSSVTPKGKKGDSKAEADSAKAKAK